MSWLEDRKNRITASKIATVCGINKFQSPFALWAEMTGRVEPFAGNSATRIGKLLEGEVARIYCEANNIPEDKLFAYGETLLLAKDNDRFGATPDFRIDDKLLETKTSKLQNKRYWDDGVPNNYYMQCQWQLYVADMETCDIACMFGADSNEFLSESIYRDENLIGDMRERALTFLEYVDSDTPPPEVDENDSRALSIVFPAVESKIFNLDDSILVKEIIHALDDIKGVKTKLNAELKELTGKQKETENQIRMLLAGAISATTVDGLITIKNKLIEKKEYIVASSSYASLTYKIKE